MLMRRSPRLAWLLVGAIVALGACGSDDPGTAPGRDPGVPVSPGALPVRDDLVDPQVVRWRTWRATDERTLEVTVTAGPTDCYGAEPEVVESDTAVRVRIQVGRLPEAAEKQCATIALESVVPVRLAAPLGTRAVEQLA